MNLVPERRREATIGRKLWQINWTFALLVSLIAGMSLLDAVLIAHMGAPVMAWGAAACFALTLAFQRFIPGT